MEYQKILEQYIDEHTDEMIADTIELCRVKSVKGEAEEGKPFGHGPYEALMKGKEICERYGFAAKSYDNYVVAADMNDQERHLDILAHMDVVAEGEGWTVTKPYEPIVKDGKIYGRGTSDDKGPAMAALYAMRAVKECGIPVTKNCRLILGSDEESGSGDLPHYYAEEPEAAMTFTPDAEFPLVNAEKGQFRMDITKQFPAQESGAVLLDLNGGTTTNIVPGRASLTVRGVSQAELEAACTRVSAETGVSFEIEPEDGENVLAEVFRIEAFGQGAHAASPDAGKNAALASLRLALELPLADCPQLAAARKLLELFPYGDNRGAALGIKRSDALSGDTTLSLNILKISGTELYARFDCRSCVSADVENTVKPAEETVKAAGFAAESSFNPPHVVDPESDFIKKLLQAYEAVTGEKGRTAAIGGGTYVHKLKRGVAFGAVGEFTDTHMHGADEFMPVEELKTAAKIFALSIAELCK